MTPEKRNAIERFLSKTYPADQPGAAVVVVENGEVVFRQAYGLANVELNVPLSADNVFRIGSLTKQFTAVAILMLVEQEKLALDAAITAYLPDYPMHGRTITLRHLLNHTSGIINYTDLLEWFETIRDEISLEDLIAVFKDADLLFEPGSQMAYSNSNYVLLGAAIEAVTGQTYAAFMDEAIFKPLDMLATAYDEASHIVPKRAAGYTAAEGNLVNAQYLHLSHPHASGALRSTLDDLVRWEAALSANTLLPQALLQQAFEPPQLTGEGESDYGFGWGISEHNGERVANHSGGILGFSSAMQRGLDRSWMIAVLSNTIGATMADQTSEHVLNIFLLPPDLTNLRGV